MRKKLLTLLLAVAASVGTMFAWDYERVQIGDLYYNLDAINQTAEVTSQNSSYPYWSTTITTAIIPASVEYNSVTYSVTSIGNSAFDRCTRLTSVTIGNSVTSIGYDAFYNCSSLTSVTIPNSVTSIGNNAFTNCSSLTSVTIPNSVTSIGNYAFYNCTGLTSVTTGNSVTSIGDWAFRNCTGLTSPVFNAHVFAFMPTSYSGAYTIPDGIESIAGHAFYKCTGLTSVTIPNSVTSIGSSAFVDCYRLTSPVFNAHVFAYMPTSYSGAYTIPDGIESIAGNAFTNCSSLTSVTIPNSVTSIGDDAFDRCTRLTSVTIPNSVTSIGDWAFRDCTGLTSPVFNAHVFAFMPTSYSGAYTIPDGIESIAGNAFYRCTGLTSVTIPNSVTSIGNGAFSGCYGLTSVTIGNSVTSIGRDAFGWCYGLTSVTIPNSVTSIGNYAFDRCTCLTSVTIPNGVTSIGNYAFSECTGLTSVTIPNSVTSIGDYAFSGCSGLTAIYVPCGEMERFKQMLNNDSRINDHAPLPYTIAIQAENGNVTTTDVTTLTVCEPFVTCTAMPNDGYHFTQWSDGNTDNPRTIILASDTTFTAEFAKNKNSYAISTISANPEWGTTAGDTAALYLDEVEISATANYGYHFVKWNDNNTSNPRTISVTEDKTYTATFAKNVYSITRNAEHGSISGDTSAEYLDEVTLTANPDYGYHFTQWSDGNTDNPRTIVLTQDTTLTAEIVIDRIGTCGDDNALTWTYEAETKTLTITGNGMLNSNYYFGIEAPTQMQKLVIGNEVTSIGDSAFYGMSTINHLIIGGSVATIGNYAFAECRNFDDITCFAAIVPVINGTTFANVGNKQYIYLFVPEARERAYHRDTYWGEFDIQVQKAEETTVTTNDVQVEPQDNAATLTWPTNDNAASYTIEITKDGVLFCTLIFNANGQLTGIAFAPSRGGQSHAPAALMTANGLQFTVTGLNSGTQYGYSVTAKDANDQPVATYSGEFTTTSEGIATGVDEVPTDQVQCTKVVRNGQLFILREGKIFNAQGARVK